MIIWHNEGGQAGEFGITDLAELTGVPVRVLRTEERNGNAHIWYALVPASPAGESMPADPVPMLTMMAGLHNEWYEAWRAAGFSESRAFELVKEVVAAAFTQG